MKSFLDFAKQTPRDKPIMNEIRIAEVFAAVLNLLGHDIQRNNIEVAIDIAQDLTVCADREHSEEIFFNRMVNACEAIKSTVTPKIFISARETGSWVKIEIKDNGPDIDARHLAQIFEPFYSTKKEGSGLGLFITKHLVEKNSGSIRVLSTANHGCCFSLKFEKITNGGTRRSRSPKRPAPSRFAGDLQAIEE